MAGLTLPHAYRYQAPSVVVSTNVGPELTLATSGGPEAHPYFLRGRLTDPRLTSDLLLSLVRVVHSRFHMPPAMLARILALADPVVTCGEERVRFEGFSACCSAYARVDLLPEAIDGTLFKTGTTNVDFNPDMRAALARLGTGREASLTVGRDAVELETDSGRVVERKVDLPMRWLKGFVEVQSHQAAMEPRMEIGGIDARRFLSGLPRQGTHGKPAWIVRSGAGLRLSQVSSPGGVRVGGIERLRMLEDLARHAKLLRIYAAGAGDASGWEVVTSTARFHLVLSSEVWRGFSGEGQALSLLARENDTAVARVRNALGWRPKLDVGDLSSSCALEPATVRDALARLGASGLVGYDLSEGAYFHRELPFDLSRLDSMQPRLKSAREIVAAKGVEISSRNGEHVVAWVRTSNGEQHVKISPDGERCSCPWYGKHQGDRGPCKHVLAVQIALDEGYGD